jgi:hypothetical protein
MRNNMKRTVYIVSGPAGVGKSRDRQRPIEDQMGKRSIILLQEFEEALNDRRHILETTSLTTEQLEEIINEIKFNNRFVVG